MNKSAKQFQSPNSLPTREQLIDFIRISPSDIGKRDIARAFGIRGGDRIFLKQLIRQLEDEGISLRKTTKSRNTAPHDLPDILVADIREKSRDGELIAYPAEQIAIQSTTPILLRPTRSRRAQKAAAIGNRVLIRLDKEQHGTKELTATLIKILGEQPAPVLGLFRSRPEGGGYFVAVRKQDKGKELPINQGDENGAQDGDLISITLLRAGRFGVPHARVKERLGSIKSERSVSLIALHSHNIPYIFPQDVLEEADKAGPADMHHREDWRYLPFITIDPPDAKDHDDAVYAEPDTDPTNEGGFIIHVAIADVAYYVRPGSSMDREALRRGNSVYFPDRVVPMLPERISNNLCSLKPDADRPALAVRMIAESNGRIRKSSFHRIMIRSHARLSYEQAQQAAEGHPDSQTAPLLDRIIKPLWDAYHCVEQERKKRSPLNLDLPERKIILNEEGYVDHVVLPPHLEAHQLIEEFMILANVAAAGFLEKHAIPQIYRVHEDPSLEKMRSLHEVLASIGLKLPKQGALRPHLFNRILATVKGGRHETFINEVVLRSQAQAHYAAENIGHFGLNLIRYAHFTSPIRRYADLIIHRGIIRAMKAGEGALPASTSSADLAETGIFISSCERRAMAAERETNDRLIAHFLSEQIGARFEGSIAGVVKAGLFVRLTETGADGFVPAASLGRDYYIYDEKRMALIGEYSGDSYQLGDKVTVKLAEAIPAAGLMRFQILDTEQEKTLAASGNRKPPLHKKHKLKKDKLRQKARRSPVNKALTIIHIDEEPEE